MEFSSSLIRGTLVKRYKRFLADVALPDGSIVTAHCPNTGAMTGCAEPGFTVFLSESTNPKRKLKYTWELAKTFDGHFIGINTNNANKLVAEALNVAYMEVKSVTLADGNHGFFPDAVTQRGAKHCLELARLAQTGIQTNLLFCVQHTAIDSVRIASHIDPAYAQSVKAAEQAGVQVLAASCTIDEQKLILNQTLPVIL